VQIVLADDEPEDVEQPSGVGPAAARLPVGVERGNNSDLHYTG
jgi:hypothetical protein